MAEFDEKKTTYKDFYNKINEQNGINAIWEKMLELIKSSCSLDDDDDVLKFFCIYFSLLDDGNTCICLDEAILYDKWITKWNGLLLVSETDFTEAEEKNLADFFKQIIKKGIVSINENKCINIAGDKIDENKLFILKQIENKTWLFPNKFLCAKLSIENRINALFPNDNENHNSENKISKIIEYFETMTGFTLEDEQALVIAKGAGQNLIVTGGPGTGKTTAVCYLLWQLFNQQDKDGISYCNYKLYLAAPSGKAAERMKESISGTLNHFNKEELQKNPKNAEIMEKLTAAESYTVHRLLNYNPGKNHFEYNRDNQFGGKSVFVIDEASMIDIILFKNLLEAIPDGAKVFILGDKDQLPSVQSGAVFEELVNKRKNSCVRLTKSKRFNNSSEVGRLKDMIEKEEEFPEEKKDWTKYGKWLSETNEFIFTREEETTNPVFFYELKTPENKIKDASKKQQLESILEKWCRVFFEDLPEKMHFTDVNDVRTTVNDKWNLVNEAKILCAERQGFRGVEEVNLTIAKKICKNKKIQIDDDGYFIGQPLIVTKNQKMFNLFNGDTGVVVGFKDSNIKYLMVEKKAKNDESEITEKEQSLFFRIDDFMFYALSLLPGDSIEPAYAITIHKSQGSEYKNLMVVLPEKPGHPLLNRQIVYTAITRTKGRTYIVANPNSLNYAKQTVIVRNTMLEI